MEKFLKSRQEGSVWWNEAVDQQENCTKKQNKKQTISFKGPNVCRQFRVSNQWSYECGRRGQLFITDQQEQREREKLDEYPDTLLTHSSVSETTPTQPCLKHKGGGGRQRQRQSYSSILSQQEPPARRLYLVSP